MVFSPRLGTLKMSSKNDSPQSNPCQRPSERNSSHGQRVGANLRHCLPYATHRLLSVNKDPSVLRITYGRRDTAHYRQRCACPPPTTLTFTNAKKRPTMSG